MTGEADAGKIEPDAWRDQTWIWLDSHDISRTFDPDAKGECPCVTMARISEPAPSPLACPRRVSRQFQECQRDAKGVRHRPKRHAERRWQARSGPSTLRVPWAKAIPYQRVIETIRGERDSEPGAKRAWRVEASAEKSITPRWGTRKSFHGRRCASRVMKHAWVPEYAGDSERLFARAHARSGIARSGCKVRLFSPWPAVERCRLLRIPALGTRACCPCFTAAWVAAGAGSPAGRRPRGWPAARGRRAPR